MIRLGSKAVVNERVMEETFPIGTRRYAEFPLNSAQFAASSQFRIEVNGEGFGIENCILRCEFALRLIVQPAGDVLFLCEVADSFENLGGQHVLIAVWLLRDTVQMFEGSRFVDRIVHWAIDCFILPELVFVSDRSLVESQERLQPAKPSRAVALL